MSSPDTSPDAAHQRVRLRAGAGRTTFTYDAAGSLSRELTPASLRTTWTNDYENRPSQVLQPADTRVTLAYWPDGLRREQQSSLSTERSVWDGQNLLLSTDASNAVTASYTHTGERYGRLLSQRVGTTSAFPHFDALGSTLRLTSDSGATLNQYLYKAFGELVSSTATEPCVFRYVGELGFQWDEPLQQYYLCAGLYQPTWGWLLGSNSISLFGNDVGAAQDGSGCAYGDCIAPCFGNPVQATIATMADGMFNPRRHQYLEADTVGSLQWWVASPVVPVIIVYLRRKLIYHTCRFIVRELIEMCKHLPARKAPTLGRPSSPLI